MFGALGVVGSYGTRGGAGNGAGLQWLWETLLEVPEFRAKHDFWAVEGCGPVTNLCGIHSCEGVGIMVGMVDD